MDHAEQQIKQDRNTATCFLGFENFKNLIFGFEKIESFYFLGY